MAGQSKAKWLLIILAIFIAVTMMACGAKKKKPTVRIEPPDIYTDGGMQLLEQGRYEEADREFTWSLERNPKNARASIGMGLAKIYEGDSEAALDFLNKGCKYAKNDKERLFCKISRIRIYTLNKQDKKWFLETREAFSEAVKIDPQSSDAYYYMGLACRDSLNFDDAGKMFREVIAMNDTHVKDAERELEQVQNIQRAMATTKTGRKIALQDHISRADCAALIMEEMKLEKVLNRQAVTDVKEAAKAKKSDNKAAAYTAKDIADHPFRVHIEGVLRLGVAGLEKYPDGTFRPEEFLNRETYAVIMEDLMEKLTGNRELKKPFEGIESPFADVKTDLPGYGAVMVVTSRGIMEPKNKNNAEFAPLGPVSGAEALSGMRKLKEELKIY